ncbi:hypothetical protein FGO68_gene1507 [Halteria grandinella]|uniref:Uncharacterized protein n=1 Tax=Halteria grandinella TaxID=5974 RepID=A0A8J8T8H5_HALGN|nr:hypothetical protein FGO68_gene1507 [Halteria grandinella]
MKMRVEPRLKTIKPEEKPCSSKNVLTGESIFNSLGITDFQRMGVSHLSVIRKSIWMMEARRDQIGCATPGIGTGTSPRSDMNDRSFIMDHMKFIANPKNICTNMLTVSTVIWAGEVDCQTNTADCSYSNKQIKQ